MSEPILSNARLSRALCESLTAWIPRQRWSTTGGQAVDLHPVAHYWLTELTPDTPGISILLVRDEAPRTRDQAPILYQLPLVIERDQPTCPTALISQVAHTQLFVSDGCAHPAGARALLEFILRARQLPGVALRGLPAAPPPGHHQLSTQLLAHRLAHYTPRLLSGEQSNTSIIFSSDDAALPGLIMKIFRVLHPGDNPDVMVQSALARAGCARIPTPIGSLRLNWHLDDCDVSGDSAFAQELIADAHDAWQLFVDAATAGQTMTEQAHQLGEVTAHIHHSLAQALGQRPASEQAKAALVSSWQQRAQTALADLADYLESVNLPEAGSTPDNSTTAPGGDGLTTGASHLADQAREIIARREQIAAIFSAAADHPWPALQRIHGDYHLGQILYSPHRGWIVLDFEGEPLRPLRERNEPDLPARDIAGMLRSFAYAAAHGNQSDAWSQACGDAFLAGYYGHQQHLAEGDPLLLALELDKALYEVSYEARQRPDWLAVPVNGVNALLERAPWAQLTPNPLGKGDNRISGINGSFSLEHPKSNDPDNSAAPRRHLMEE